MELQSGILNNLPPSQGQIPNQRAAAPEENLSKTSKIAKEKIKPKAKETEDYNHYTSKYLSHNQSKPLPHPTLVRQSSSPNLHYKSNTPKTALAKRAKRLTKEQIAASGVVLQRDLNKSGGLWEHVKSLPDRSGGRLEVIHLKKEFDSVTPKDKETQNTCLARALEKMHLIFPGVEPSGEEFKNYLKTNQSDQGEILKIIKKLGYRFELNDEGVYLTLPDLKVLNSRWKKMQERLPGLSDLNIISAKGITNSRSFARAHLENDAVLSSTKHFIHDQTAHILALIALKISSCRSSEIKPFEKIKYQQVRFINSILRKIEILNSRPLLTEEDKEMNGALVDRMETILAGFVDGVTTLDTLEEYKKAVSKDPNTIMLDWIQNYKNNNLWKNFFVQFHSKKQINTTIRALTPDLKKQGFSGDELKKKIANVITPEFRENSAHREGCFLENFSHAFEKIISKLEKEFDAKRIS